MYENIIGTIGNTPLVKLEKIITKKSVEVFAKLEGYNPAGSIKDRIAKRMILEAEKKGKLFPGKTIIEATSGNTGIALAMIGAVKNYSVEIVMSKAVSKERQDMIKAFGAKIILTDENKGTDGAIYLARKLTKENPSKYFMPDQFNNDYNKLEHYQNTADEIWKQMDGKIDYFVSSIGTSGTIMGVGKALLKKNPNLKIICAYPEKGHYIQGLKNMEEAIVPGIYDEKLLDEKILINTQKAFQKTREIVKKEGIFVGMSSGAAMVAVEDLVKRISKGRVVVIFPDRGEKYLSTGIFREE